MKKKSRRCGATFPEYGAPETKIGKISGSGSSFEAPRPHRRHGFVGAVCRRGSHHPTVVDVRTVETVAAVRLLRLPGHLL